MHNRLKSLSSQEIYNILLYLGFKFKRQRGSHQHWVKEQFRVTVVANKKSFSKGTLLSIIRQSTFTENDWLKALDNL